jgi:HSP20 family molecular chaperone IbpA
MEENMFFDYLNYRTDYNFKEEKDKYIFQLDIPGYDKENISVEIVRNRLCIQANNDERGEVKRIFNMSEMDIGETIASYKNGVLVLELLKKEGATKLIKIN